MPYCSREQLVTKFGESELVQLTDQAGIGVIDDAVLAAAQSAADSDINKRLRMKGWIVPLATVSADIVAIALDITRFHLYSAQMTEIVEKAYNRRIKELDSYVAGNLMLDIGEPDSAAPPSAGDVGFVRGGRIFNDSSMSGF